jgi:hypothetical protein
MVVKISRIGSPEAPIELDEGGKWLILGPNGEEIGEVENLNREEGFKFTQVGSEDSELFKDNKSASNMPNRAGIIIGDLILRAK